MNFRTTSYNYSAMTFADFMRLVKDLLNLVHDEAEDKTNIS